MGYVLFVISVLIVLMVALTIAVAHGDTPGPPRANSHWAFTAPKRPTAPRASNPPWARNRIDLFVHHRLDLEKIHPAAEADKPTLIRRLSLDLIGLPPSPVDVRAFVRASASDAYEQLVDRLLASPHFGEKWARWWMDLAHYGDSDGYLTDQLRPVAWRWRQWVVDAFNRNQPFDQFTIEQIAGDLLPDSTAQQRIATGFFRNTLSNREGGADLEEFRTLQVLDRTATFGATWLGLTLACSQCHDHKHDPITQKEFYQLYDFFNNADELNIPAPLPGEREAYLSQKEALDKQRQEALAPVATELKTLQQRWESMLLETEANPGRDHLRDRELELLGLIWGGGLGEGQLEGLNIVHTPWPERSPQQRDRLQDYFLQRGSIVDPPLFRKLKLEAIRQKLVDLTKRTAAVTRAPTLVQHRTPRMTRVALRGDFRRPGEVAPPGVPATLHPMQATRQPNRLTLARWTVDPANPMTARVTVNRLWQELFGAGLVSTADDFGTHGKPPSHPDLLDCLATEFIRCRWDLKAMIKLMVSSASYRQASGADSAQRRRDPDNLWLGRGGRRRLSAELIRDNALAASGLLERRIGGPSVRPPQPESVIKESFSAQWEVSRGANRYRRGLYTFVQRTSPFAQNVTFDFPDNNQSCARRLRSNTPMQALTLLNDPLFFEAAGALANRILQEGGHTVGDRLDYAFLLCLARTPQAEELNRLFEFLETETKRAMKKRSPAPIGTPGAAPLDTAQIAAWTRVASVLLNLDEFITRE